MLNYVWISLLFLGLASALFIDISDITKNTYNNDVPLTVAIKTAAVKSGGGFDSQVYILKANHNQFLNAKETEGRTGGRRRLDGDGGRRSRPQ